MSFLLNQSSIPQYLQPHIKVCKIKAYLCFSSCLYETKLVKYLILFRKYFKYFIVQDCVLINKIKLNDKSFYGHTYIIHKR